MIQLRQRAAPWWAGMVAIVQLSRIKCLAQFEPKFCTRVEAPLEHLVKIRYLALISNRLSNCHNLPGQCDHRPLMLKKKGAGE